MAITSILGHTAWTMWMMWHMQAQTFHDAVMKKMNNNKNVALHIILTPLDTRWTGEMRMISLGGVCRVSDVLGG